MKKTDKQVIKELRAENKKLKTNLEFRFSELEDFRIQIDGFKKGAQHWKTEWDSEIALNLKLMGLNDKMMAELNILSLDNSKNEAIIKNYENVCNNYKDLNDHKSNEINILTKELTLAKIRINKLIDNLK